MSHSLRREVLRMFKKLHRTRLNTFMGDEHMLEVARTKINEEYKKYKHVTNPEAIEELNKFAQDVEHEVKTTVIQAVETKPGTFELRITPDTVMLDNESYTGPTEKCHTSQRKRSSAAACNQTAAAEDKK